MTAQHTPAPWKVRHTHQCGRYEVRGPGDTFTGQPHGAWICGDANETNAHLIAAAPELLAALIDLLGDTPRNNADGECTHCGRDNSDHRNEPCSDDCPGEIARAAIAKATGA
jgi:hypothetical protein